MCVCVCVCFVVVVLFFFGGGTSHKVLCTFNTCHALVRLNSGEELRVVLRVLMDLYNVKQN